MGITSLDPLQSAWTWASGLRDAVGEASLMSATLPDSAASRRLARPWLRPRVCIPRRGCPGVTQGLLCRESSLSLLPKVARSVSCLHFPLFLHPCPSLHHLWHIFSPLSYPFFLIPILLPLIISLFFRSLVRHCHSYPYPVSNHKR